MGRLDGKVAVITGAAGGIGREAAVLFSEEGASVVVADVGTSAGAQAASECKRAVFIEVDVSDPASVRALYTKAVETYGGVDILYNNAGIMPPDDDSILTTETEAYDRVQAVNAKGVYLCCKYGIPHLLERGGGSVINVASFVARWRGDIADRLHGVEGCRAVHEPRARGPVRTPGCSGQRTVPRTRRDALADAPVLGQSCRVRAPPRAPTHGQARHRARDRQRGIVSGRR